MGQSARGLHRAPDSSSLYRPLRIIMHLAALITDEQLATYQRDGAVTIDTPWSSAELDRFEACWDRLQDGSIR